MSPRIRVPSLKNPNILVRLAKTTDEIEAANRLVRTNYVEKGYWEPGEEENKYLRSPKRTVFVMMEGEKVRGTASILRDSEEGLPSDTFDAAAMSDLRRTGDKLAEVTALAIDKNLADQKTLVLFLFKYVIQYSFYYTDLDRFVVSCTPRHAAFYESIIRFNRVTQPARYQYVKVEAQLLTLNLVSAHQLLAEHYEAPENPNNFYRFFMVEEHPNLQFPPRQLMHRPRDVNWVEKAQQLHT